MPENPTTVPLLASEKKIPSKTVPMVSTRIDQSFPPLVVPKITPAQLTFSQLPPAMNPLLASMKLTSHKDKFEGDDCKVQDVPPFVVLRIVPPLPTTQPLFESVKHMPRKALCGSAGIVIQFCPPSVVLSIIPQSPTAIPLFASVKKTSYNQSHSVPPLDC